VEASSIKKQSTRLAERLAIASGIVGILASAVLLALCLLGAPQTVAAGAQTSCLRAINDGLGDVPMSVTAILRASRLAGTIGLEPMAMMPRVLDRLLLRRSPSMPSLSGA
jgi:hypothetical protein